MGAVGRICGGADLPQMRECFHSNPLSGDGAAHFSWQWANITIGNYNFEGVNNFNYLGSNISSDNDGTKEIRKRIGAAIRAFCSLLPVFKSKNVYRETKLKLYKTLIRTVLSYGSETWTMAAKSAELLDNLERRTLRRIYRPVAKKSFWRVWEKRDRWASQGQDGKIAQRKDTRYLLGIRNWREQSRDRDGWRQKIDEAKARQG
ncbi:hypothetical protein J437_LFUL003621 [Ladona fulva]|uniref:Uncharacterized protein n=1 Tax=Ladona fulva TaxID=123851 RepID=A0A8K0KHX6_LADFU|nr:hypothetical protein J437_LFUL003621 [Ladona fulva]